LTERKKKDQQANYKKAAHSTTKDIHVFVQSRFGKKGSRIHATGEKEKKNLHMEIKTKNNTD